MLDTFAQHWPNYLIEATLLGTFMVVACSVVVIFSHRASPIPKAIPSPTRRRVLVGVLMGLTAIALIYSPLGQRSGAHMNPGTTLTFWTLGKVQTWDAIAYIASQFIGGLAGTRIARLLLGKAVEDASVRYAATQPGPKGIRVAWFAECIIAFIMMSMVLASSNYEPTASFTGVFAGVLVAVFITIEAPYSGMSLNPARTLASAVPARAFRGLWLYFTAPPAGMLLASIGYTALVGASHVYCAKINHRGDGPCIFHCEIQRLRHPSPTSR